MRYRALGSSGLVVSVVGLGTNNFGLRSGLEEAKAVVTAALDAGITLIDTADSYGNKGGSEEILAKALKGVRDDVVLATKFGSDMAGSNGNDFGARASRRYMMRAVEASLRRLDTDWIDLYQLHWLDGCTPLEETLSGLDDLVRQGKVRYVGSSNLAAWQVVEADFIAREAHLSRFISAQNHYSLLHRAPEHELAPACCAHEVSMIAYYPLASGLLTGKWRAGDPPPPGSRLADGWGTDLVTDQNFEIIEALRRFSIEVGASMLDLAIGALAERPAVGSVITGATTPQQVRQNASAADFVPTPGQLRQLDEVIAGAG
ncbi:MAG: aldo/keto reductase [Acidimicrobiales bacterium]